MSKYTTEVRFICETASGLTESVGYHSINEVISKSREKVFDFDYPIFDPQYKSVLETKILKHFYTREICEETVGLWKLRLDRKMNEIMPYFNKLYESELLAFNPLFTVDVKKKNTGSKVDNEDIRDNTKKNDNVDSTGLSSANGKEISGNVNRNLYSDTPQGSLQNIEDETYLTNARKTTDDGTVKSSNDNTSIENVKSDSVTDYERNRGFISTDDYLEVVQGYNGKSGSQLLNEFRDTFLNIDVMIIERLEELFMQLW